MSNRRVVVLAAVAVAVAGGLALAHRGRAPNTRFATAAVDRGDIAEVVGATGVLEAVTTVQVGSQVSGTIQELHADFNSVVRKGQVIARLDPSIFEARLAQAKANLMAARAQVERSRSTIADTRQKYERARELAAQSLLPQTDLETAEANHDGARAQLDASLAAVSQADAAVNQARVDLGHTVIAAPIDGVVLARNVDVGQTVAASLQAPTLFVIANDLTRMQANASIDEADIGRVRPGQAVSFRVDAYPERIFAGRVEQVRLQPVAVQNVVTYNTIISVENADLRLMPGMTATVSVVVRSREGVLRAPASALRFRPEGFDAPGAAVAGLTGERPALADTGRATGSRRGAGEARSAGAREGAQRRRAGGDPDGRRAPAETLSSGRERGRPGLLFVLGDDGKPKPAPVRTGLSDGRFVEVVDGLEEGLPVVTGTLAPGAVAPSGPAASANPFERPRFQPRQR